MYELRKYVRQHLGLQGTPYPVAITPGDSPPALAGESYHWVTPGGKPVTYPNAYRRAWGKPVYVNSTRRIEVGRLWLTRHGFKATLDAA